MKLSKNFWGITSFAIIFGIGIISGTQGVNDGIKGNSLFSPQYALAQGSEQPKPDTTAAEKKTVKKGWTEYTPTGDPKDNQCYWTNYNKSTTTCSGQGTTVCKADVSTSTGDSGGPTDCQSN